MAAVIVTHQLAAAIEYLRAQGWQNVEISRLAIIPGSRPRQVLDADMPYVSVVEESSPDVVVPAVFTTYEREKTLNQELQELVTDLQASVDPNAPATLAGVQQALTFLGTYDARYDYLRAWALLDFANSLPEEV
jgi:hypothetical protein